MENVTSNQQTVRRTNQKVVVIALVLAVVVGGLMYLFICSKGRIKTSSEYQAVFLTNGQVYFGKLGKSGKWMTLSDIYYLQVTEDLQPASGNDSNTPSTPSTPANQNQQIQLVKLGSELHGPEDTMYIPHDKILFWENLKADSKVVQSIKQSQSK